MTTSSVRSILAFLIAITFASTAMAQSTTFTYQGRLDDGGAPANGSYNFEFHLFDQASGGSEVGPTVGFVGVPVVNGAFSVPLDFGDVFQGDPRWLEIRMGASAPAGQNVGGLTILTPRQLVYSVPYALRSASAASADTAVSASIADSATTADTAANALNLGGVAAGQYVVTTDSRLSDARSPLPGSGSYIQNRTSQQPSSAFNISGTGKAGVFDAGTNFSISGVPFLSTNPVSKSGVFLGKGAGISNTNGGDQTFVGRDAGAANTQYSNSFFGAGAGSSNVTGQSNAFFGALSGENSTAGSQNAFFGAYTGSVATGSGNSFFGSTSGNANTSGASNTFLGSSTGKANTTGSFNTAIGTQATFGAGNLSNATSVGARARVDTNNSLVLGSINGVNGATASTRVGIGTSAPTNLFTVVGAGSDVGGVMNYSEVVARFRQTTSNTHLGVSIDALVDTDPILYLSEDGAAKWDIRNDATFDSFQIRYQEAGANSTKFAIHTNGFVTIPFLGTGGSTAICRNGSNELSTCSSSKRYKSNIESFRSGSEILDRLRPVTFNWKDSGALDLGLVAEEVADIDPLLATFNAAGQVEGVKYDRIGVVLVNVVKEQQSLLRIQNEKLKRQSEEIGEQAERVRGLEESISAHAKELAVLKAALCSRDKSFDFCQE